MGSAAPPSSFRSECLQSRNHILMTGGHIKLDWSIVVFRITANNLRGYSALTTGKVKESIRSKHGVLAFRQHLSFQI